MNVLHFQQPRNRSMNAHEVVMLDLNSMCANLKEEFATLSGKRVLITGGAGFLGHYFIQSALHWNNHVHVREVPIQVVVYDSFVRGMPQWLSKLEADRNLVLIRHDIRNPRLASPSLSAPGHIQATYAIHSHSHPSFQLGLACSMSVTRSRRHG